MNDRNDTQQLAFQGQCASCRQARLTVSDRGARFIRCERAKVDGSYPKYPRLPVLTCRGYDPDEGRVR